MLKIKDNIDLKELEKYGYFKRDYNYKTNKYDGEYYCSSFKICKNLHLRPYNGTNQNRYDEIYDLIKDGLVEKVSDNE